MMKVLIVDDQPELRHVLRICLSAVGVEILEAGNGEKALATVKEHNPEIIILDVMLPDLSGIEVCSRDTADCSWRLSLRHHAFSTHGNDPQGQRT